MKQILFTLLNSGWRPAIMWICALCILYSFILYPWLVAIAIVNWPELYGKLPPQLDDELWAIISGVLGIGGMRTYEKKHGIIKGKHDENS